MADVWNEAVNTSEITGGAENALSPHAGIPHTGRRGSGLLFEADH
jgi:hypothetical protein